MININIFSGEKMHDMQCMLSTSPSTYLMGGHQTKMLELDINKKDIVREVGKVSGHGKITLECDVCPIVSGYFQCFNHSS